MLNDIAILTGATVISDDTGLTLEKVTAEHLGSAARVEVSKDNTIIVDGAGEKDAIAERISAIQAQSAITESDYDKEKLEERLAKLDGGVAVIKIGAATEVEMKEKKDRVDDALHATRAAVEEGVVAGGGVAFLFANQAAEIPEFENNDQRAGSEIVRVAIEAPIRQIILNAGHSPDVTVNSIKFGPVDAGDNYGYNAANGEFGNMIELGIIDPAKVTKTALINAASIAGLLLTSECAITDIPSDDKAAVNPGMGMM